MKMPLTQSQFKHIGLYYVHRGGTGATIPMSVQGKCQRLVDAIESAVYPEDTDLPGMGYQCSGNQYSLAVNGVNRITYRWPLGMADRIDYV